MQMLSAYLNITHLVLNRYLFLQRLTENLVLCFFFISEHALVLMSLRNQSS